MSEPDDHFRVFAEAYPGALGIFGRDGMLRYANRRLLGALGAASLDSVAGRRFRDIHAVPEKPSPVDYFSAVLEQVEARGRWAGTLPLATPQGLPRYVTREVFKLGAGGEIALLARESVAQDSAAAPDLVVALEALHASINAVALADLDGRLTFVNKAFLDLWAVDHPVQVVGKSATDFWESPVEAEKVIQSLLTDGRWNGNLIARRDDSRIFVLDVSARLICGPSGEPICMMAAFLESAPGKGGAGGDDPWLLETSAYAELMLRPTPVEAEGRATPGRLDALGGMISGFHEIQAHLRSERDFARALLDTAPVIVLLLDLDGNVREVNPYFEELTGFERDQFRGRNWFDNCLPERCRDATRRLFADAIASGDSVESEPGTNPILTCDGRELEIEWNNRLLRDPSGRPVGLLAIGHDVTARQRAELEAAKSRQLFVSFMQHSPLMAHVKDGERRYVYLNPVFERFVRSHDEADWIGHRTEDFVPEPKAAEVRRIDEALLAGAGPMIVENETMTADGARHFLSVRFPIIMPDGERMLGCQNLDITDRVKAEQELRDALKEREVLLREIHHRVKNNLQVVSSLLFFQEENAASEADRIVMREGRARLRSMMLVHEALYRTGNVAAIDLSAYLNTLARDVLNIHAGLAGKVSVEILAPAEAVKVDIEMAVPLGLIACELLNNALKHAFPGRQEGRVAFILSWPAAGTLRFEVADDGVGMRADRDPAMLSGFGWRLVRGLAEQLGASLQTAGGPGEGHRVQLDLRCMPDAAGR